MLVVFQFDSIETSGKTISMIEWSLSVLPRSGDTLHPELFRKDESKEFVKAMNESFEKDGLVVDYIHWNMYTGTLAPTIHVVNQSDLEK